VDTHFVGSG